MSYLCSWIQGSYFLSGFIRETQGIFKCMFMSHSLFCLFLNWWAVQWTGLSGEMTKNNESRTTLTHISSFASFICKLISFQRNLKLSLRCWCYSFSCSYFDLSQGSYIGFCYTPLLSTEDVNIGIVRLSWCCSCGWDGCPVIVLTCFFWGNTWLLKS